MSKKECEHNEKAIYFRKKINGSENQGWFKVKGYLICDKCQKISKILKEDVNNDRRKSKN